VEADNLCFSDFLRTDFNRIKIPSSARLVVVGDIHGQLADLLHIFYKAGWPSETNMCASLATWVRDAVAKLAQVPVQR
jgi:hypothetical protein